MLSAHGENQLIQEMGDSDNELPEESKAMLLIWRDTNGNSLLHYAAMAPHLAVVDTLLDAGAWVDGANATGTTPVMLAACRVGPHNSLTSLLANSASLTAVDSTGRGVLHYAAYFGCGDAVIAVLRAAEGKLDVNAGTVGGVTPLMLAAGSTVRSQRDAHGFPSPQRLHAVAALLRAGAACSTRDCKGDTALSYAIRARNDEAALLLVVSGAPLEHGSTRPGSPAALAATRPTLSAEDASSDDSADWWKPAHAAAGSPQRVRRISVARLLLPVGGAPAPASGRDTAVGTTGRRSIIMDLIDGRTHVVGMAGRATGASAVSVATDTPSPASGGSDAVTPPAGGASPALAAAAAASAPAPPAIDGSDVDACLSRFGFGHGVVALAALLRASANAWNPPREGEEGAAGRAGLPRRAAVAAQSWCRDLLLLALRAEPDGGVGDATGLAAAAGPDDAAAPLRCDVTPIEYLTYALVLSGGLPDLLGFGPAEDSSVTLGGLLLSRAPRVADRIGMTAAFPRVDPAMAGEWRAEVEARLAPAAAAIGVAAALAETDATGRGFQWLRASCDVVRVAGTYDGSAAHDFDGWSVDAAVAVASGRPNDAAAMVQARRALGSASADEVLRVVAAAARSGNHSAVQAFLPLAWDVRLQSPAHGFAVDPSLTLASVALADATRSGRVAGMLRAADDAAEGAASRSPADAFTGPPKREDAFAPAAWQALAAYYRALHSAWRAREDRFLSSRVCNPRTGCVDPAAGCMAQ